MSDQPFPLPSPRHGVAPPAPGLPPSRPNPFTPQVAMPPPRPIAKPEEGERRGEGLAVLGSATLVLLVAALLSWVLYLALA